MKKFFNLLTLAAILGLAPVSKGAVVTWESAATMAADTDVRTTGTFERAYNFGNETISNATINGVTFTAFGVITAPGGGSTGTKTIGQTTMALSSGTFYSAISPSTVAPFSSLSSSYQAMAAGTMVAGTGLTISLTLNGLTNGQQYLFQLWSSMPTATSRAISLEAGNSVILDTNTTNAIGGVGQFGTGAFTADATSQVFTITASGGSDRYPTVSGFQLRTVPEPATWALLAGSLTTVMIFRRRRAS